MLKDLNIALSSNKGCQLALGEKARAYFQVLAKSHPHKDFSFVFKALEDKLLK
jgi:hypothetical protein